MLSAVLLGLASGAESDLIAFLAGRYFGMAHYGKIYGMLYMPFGIASAISPAVYGAIRDRDGNYDAMLLVAMALFVVGALLLLALGRYPEFARGGNGRQKRAEKHRKIGEADGGVRGRGQGKAQQGRKGGKGTIPFLP
ncbi:MAG: MFS transporter [Gammaproteobacteria bacterium]|nr:MFS transporter [Gammaproteobacteria bacterium]